MVTDYNNAGVISCISLRVIGVVQSHDVICIHIHVTHTCYTYSLFMEIISLFLLVAKGANHWDVFISGKYLCLSHSLISCDKKY